MRTVLAPPGMSSAVGALGLTALLLMRLGSSSGAPSPPAGQEPDPDSFRIAVDVSLVVLHATVTYGQGSLVTNLGERNFEVYENGVRQQIRLFRNEDVPVTVGLIVDHSTTMRPKIVEVTSAARVFAVASNPEDEMFVVNFHEIASLGLPPAMRFTHDAAILHEAIMAAPTEGETALYDGIALGLDHLRAGTRDKKVLIVLSDGGDNASHQSLDQVLKVAGQSGAVIYTVGLFDEGDPDRNPGALRRLARETGGEAFMPRELQEVLAICKRIARDIRHQYTIGYVPINRAHDGSRRSIRLVAKTQDGEKLSVRTRSGYTAQREAQPNRKDGK